MLKKQLKLICILLISCLAMGSICIAYANTNDSGRNPLSEKTEPKKTVNITAVCEADKNISTEQAKEMFKAEKLSEKQLAYINEVNTLRKESINEWITFRSSKILSEAIYGYLDELENGDLIDRIEKTKDKMVSVNELPAYHGPSVAFHFSECINRIKQGPIYISNSTSISLQFLNSCHPIKHLEKIDDNHVLLVYKADVSETENYTDSDTLYFYLVAEKRTTDYSEYDLQGYYENWNVKTKELYFVTKSLKYSDFSSIKIGDSRDKVAKIEPAANYLSATLPTSTHPLEDGLLKISYDSNNNVSAMEFHPYGDIYSDDGTEIFNILRAETPVELPKQ